MINKIQRFREAWKETIRKSSRPLDRIDRWLFFPVVILVSIGASAVSFYRFIIYTYDNRLWTALQELIITIILLWIIWEFVKRLRRGYT